MADEIIPCGATAENPFYGKRTAARVAGAKYYVNLRRECLYGHVPTVRLVSNTSCVACAHEWHGANKSQINENKRAHRKANPDFYQSREAARYRANPDYFKEYARRWKGKNKEYKAQKDIIWRAKNAERLKYYWNEWRLNNPEAARAKAHNRRARKIAAPGQHSPSDIRAIHKLQKGCCAYCKRKLKIGYHLDHIMPLALGGSNDRKNLQILCEPCNKRKGAKHPIDFAQQNLGLLL